MSLIQEMIFVCHDLITGEWSRVTQKSESCQRIKDSPQKENKRERNNTKGKEREVGEEWYTEKKINAAAAKIWHF